MTATVLHGDCIAEMRAMADGCVDAIVCDPPYLISFMGRDWDSADGIAGKPEVWREALRVLRPGGHMLSFGGARTYHRMVCAIEDAGFEIRDQIFWVYGSGFPKSLDVSKQLDKMAGAEREVIGKSATHTTKRMNGGAYNGNQERDAVDVMITAPATPEAQQWAGFGTALKPAHEPIVVARKPLIGTVAQNVLAHGCGALNIDASRINPGELIPGGGNGKANNGGRFGAHETNGERPLVEPHTAGRWPSNCIHDGSDEVLDAFAAFGERKSRSGAKKANKASIGYGGSDVAFDTQGYGNDTGTAARFFYAAKASKSERAGSNHPTVKPLSLMKYLCRLVCPPGGTVLDMFCGSGTTLLAAQMEGFHAVGIEQDAGYVADAKRRLGLTFELEAAD